METNPNPILHFNERPGASPDYRFDYVETNINLGTSAPPVARNKGFTRIDFEENRSNSTPDQIPYLHPIQHLLKKRSRDGGVGSRKGWPPSHTYNPQSSCINHAFADAADNAVHLGLIVTKVARCKPSLLGCENHPYLSSFSMIAVSVPFTEAQIEKGLRAACCNLLVYFLVKVI